MPKTITGKIKLKKPTRHTALSLVALVLWCAFIFYMSARVAQDSDALSLGFAGRFLHLVVPGFSDMSAADQLALAKSINHPVRKLAHFTEYLVLGILAVNALRLHISCSAGAPNESTTAQTATQPTTQTAAFPTEHPNSSVEDGATIESSDYPAAISAGTTSHRNLIISALSWVFCILYAASDEFHQLFVPGRAGLVTDVCIDSAGALLGILLFLAALHLTSRHAKRKQGAASARPMRS